MLVYRFMPTPSIAAQKTWNTELQGLKPSAKRPIAPGLKPRPPKRLRSAAGALKIAHEAGECFHGVQSYRVIKRNAHSTNRAVARRADQTGCGGLFAELFFHGFVSAAYAK